MTTILVIEDSEEQRAEVRAALESSGLFDRILEARDGIEGLRMFLSESPDLVLCDLEMPGIAGEKLLRMKGGGEDQPVATPFLVLTAVTDTFSWHGVAASGPSLGTWASPLMVAHGDTVTGTVVASSVGAAPELIRDGENGVLVPPGDADKLADVLARLAHDPGECVRLSAAASATRVSTARDTAVRLEHVYRQVMEIH